MRAGTACRSGRRYNHEMNILVVFAHPIRESFTGQIMDNFVKGAARAGHSIDINDLYASNFKPVMSPEELVLQFEGKPPPDEILAEQARYEACDAMVLVFPVWWWTVPAILKGWFERVFTAGWAYPIDVKDPACTLSGERKGMILCCGGASKATYEEQGKEPTVARTLARSTFGYINAKHVTTHIFHGARTSVDISDDCMARRTEYLRQAYEIGKSFG